MKKKFLVLVLVVFVALAATLRVLSLRAPLYFIGTIEATQVDIAPRVASVIAEFLAREGEKVKKDQVLVRLAGEDLKLAADTAGRVYERAVRLYKSGSMPQEAYEHLRARRDEARLKWEWTSVLAPMDATVLNTFRERGEWVSPGMKLLTLADLSEVWALIYVDQPVMARLAVGMAVQGEIPGIADGEFSGKIARIADEAEFTPKNVQTWSERTRLVYAVKVTFPNPKGALKPGMPIQVNLPKETLGR